MVVVKVKRLRAGAVVPGKAHPGDAGWDLYCPEAWELGAYGKARIPLGIATEIPPGWYAQVLGRSGLAAKGVYPVGGVIDSTYRGEWSVLLVNASPFRVAFEAGDKVAQAVILPVPPAGFAEADELDATDRGAGGFGSTGR